MKNLSQAKAGNVYTIKWTFGIPDFIEEFLRGYEIMEGSVVRVISQFAGNLIVESNNHRFAIGKEVADHIRV